MKSKPVRVYEDDYNLLSRKIEELSKLWERKATFADAIKHLLASKVDKQKNSPRR